MTEPCYIFLDVDGVLNSTDWHKRRGPVPGNWTPLFSTYELDPEACLFLQSICDEFQASLVVTSTWRLALTTGEIHDLFVQRGLTAPVIGSTPDLSRNFIDGLPDGLRGLEVQWWLQKNLPSDEAVCNAKFVCLDDELDYGDLLGKLVQTRFATGLRRLEGDFMGKHLREPLMNSMAAGGKGRVLFKHDVLGLVPR